ncbi:MAG: sigma-70 family RNA polymerase sigma factor [Caulobacteraceae bacterium]|nr:sigma-70 family RNA polymerase sigma factor [Caulobacteraceae bacterium]
MSETTWAALRHRLLDGYDEFVRRLARRLGSADLAREIIHETYLRFQRVGDMEPVHNPDGYIFRTAVNIAKNRNLIERRYLNASETQMLIGIPDDAPDPARTATARLEMDLLRRALAQLPPRRREIFEASWADEVPHTELAIRYGVHVRTIQRELEQATKFVRRWWKENTASERRISPPRLSSDHGQE